jgi:kynureninase
MRIDKALIDDYQIIPDFRAPDNIRFGFAPIYTTFTEVQKAVSALMEIVEQEVFLKYSQDKPTVT